ncbi:MAG: M3 family metallopeptidase [Bacteroidales bacterium]|nr:M3 family metallopeptidase [Bacteroidales bacterium]
MRKSVFLIAGLALLAGSCKQNDKISNMKNPLLNAFNTPFEVPPFAEIKLEDFAPAIREGIKVQEAEIEDIINNKEAPDFANTIVALEESGSLLNKVESVFDNLNSSLTSEDMQKIAEELSPALSAHSDAIRMNEKLFKRVQEVYNKRENSKLKGEDSMLLENTYKYFVRGGANLSPENKEKLKSINESLSLLSLKFGQNVLSEINNFKLLIDDPADLSGLPEAVIAQAAETAIEKGDSGKWVFTVQKPSLIPFITYSDKRELREKLFKAYTKLGDNNNEFDNKEILSKIVNLRIEKAHLLDYPSHAAFVLERNMAKTPEKVMSFLNDLWSKALPVAGREAENLQKLINEEGNSFKLEPWDWWYYSEKLRKAKYDIDEEEMRPYFKLENVRNGAFEVANKLYGIQFIERKDIPVYQEDVQAFEVKDKDGSHLGVLYMDFYPRASKRSGAWMSEYRSQQIKDGKDIRPIVTTNFNFSKPTGDKPALISYEEVETLFHEFGHALQGLLTKCHYPSLSGTSVPRDFVELCSQVMENWAAQPEVLKSFAKRYDTGEVIPESLLKKMDKSKYFNQGFVTVEYLAASLLDMDYHTLTQPDSLDAAAFENKAMNDIGLIPEIIVRYRSTYFNHIFSGGYSAGYYAYIWAEVLDSDAFEAFLETGNIFDPKTAEAFRKNILEPGGTVDPMKLYLQFRDKEPNTDALLRKRGLI